MSDPTRQATDALLARARRAADLARGNVTEYDMARLYGDLVAEVERLQAENEELKHRGAGRPLLSAALDEAEAEVERLRAANSVPTDVTRPTPDTGHLLTRDADILAEAHSWLSLNADPDAVEAEGAVTPTAHLIRDLKGYAERLAAALREAMRDKADAARPTPETPNGDDFCQHCGGGPLLICSFCGPQRTTTIDPGSRAMSEHLTPFESDRGFLYMPEIAGKHPGSRIKVHQSSSAEGPHVWVGADDGETVVLVHLPAERARQFAEQILWLLAPAAEPARPVRDVLADLMCRHSLIADWYEKADLVLDGLAANDLRVTAGLAGGDQPAPTSERCPHGVPGGENCCAISREADQPDPGPQEPDTP